MRDLLVVLGVLVTLSQCRSLGLGERGEPTFLNRALVKRTDPSFYDRDFGEFGKTPDGDDKKQLLKDGIEDVYKLVSTALTNWSDDIFDRWFPAGKEEVMNALLAIVPDPTRHPKTGGDELKYFAILPDNGLQVPELNDVCERGADVYTFPSGRESAWLSYSCFCPKAFDGDQPIRLSGLDCEEDFHSSGGRYRMTSEMKSLGATILHAMMHYNTIGETAGLTEVDRNGWIISDIGIDGDDDDQEDKYVDGVADPYEAYVVRQTSDAEQNMCMLNADNYVWLVLELYWTQKCSDQLRDQGGRFDEPQL